MIRMKYINLKENQKLFLNSWQCVDAGKRCGLVEVCISAVCYITFPIVTVETLTTIALWVI